MLLFTMLLYNFEAFGRAWLIGLENLFVSCPRIEESAVQGATEDESKAASTYKHILQIIESRSSANKIEMCISFSHDAGSGEDNILTSITGPENSLQCTGKS
jgi:hypothetical protein